jgi:hypothetical protein
LKIFFNKGARFQKLEPLSLLHEVEFNKHGELQVGPMPTRPRCDKKNQNVWSMKLPWEKLVFMLLEIFQ